MKSNIYLIHRYGQSIYVNDSSFGLKIRSGGGCCCLVEEINLSIRYCMIVFMCLKFMIHTHYNLSTTFCMYTHYGVHLYGLLGLAQ